MQLLSVNVGKMQPIENGKKSGKTGIYKIHTSAPVQIGRLGLEGDTIVDTENHGGEDQAVYVFGSIDYEWWSSELGRDLPPGTFGENLTISELESAPVNVGDRLRVGAVLLEVTAPRIPCVTLAARMGDPTFVKRFRHAERPGLYCRVIEPGAVCTGDPVSLAPYQGETVSALDLFRLFYNNNATVAMLRRVLAAPIDIRARREYEVRLAELLDKAKEQ
ncbi:MAG: MOSC domain-containing protein [Aggregatilineales bacterium]